MTVGTNALLEERGARDRPDRHRGASPTCSRSAARTARASTTRAGRGRAPLVEPELRFEARGAHRAATAWSRSSTDDEVERLVGAVARLRAPSRSPSACCSRSPIPTHERADRRRPCARRLPERPRLGLARGAARLPRVRALLDHRDRRLPLPPARPLPRARSPTPARERGLPEPAGDALLGRHRRRRRRPPAPGPGACSRARPAARSGAALLARAAGDGRRDRPRHGRHLVRRLRRRGRRGAAHRLPRDRGPPDPAADGRRPHRRRRRRLDRLARPGRRAPRRPALGGRRAGARLLRARRHRADGHRRQPAARLPRPATPRSPAASSSTATRPSRASPALGERARPGRDRDRRGDRPGRQPGDGPGAAGGHRRARRRPARLRAAALRRRRPDARRGPRRGARDRPGSSAPARAACSRRSA